MRKQAFHQLLAKNKRHSRLCISAKPMEQDVVSSLSWKRVSAQVVDRLLLVLVDVCPKKMPLGCPRVTIWHTETLLDFFFLM